jgi:hypothetical protein
VVLQPSKLARRWEQNALRQGHIAVNSILRDWMKDQITAIECGILSFEAVFMPYMLATDGRPLIERLAESNLLPAPEEAKVVTLPGPHSGGCPLSFAHSQLQLLDGGRGFWRGRLRIARCGRSSTPFQ